MQGTQTLPDRERGHPLDSQNKTLVLLLAQTRLGNLERLVKPTMLTLMVEAYVHGVTGKGRPGGRAASDLEAAAYELGVAEGRLPLGDLLTLPVSPVPVRLAAFRKNWT